MMYQAFIDSDGIAAVIGNDNCAHVDVGAFIGALVSALTEWV